MTDRASPAVPRPSSLCLPSGPWATVLDFLCGHFAAIDRATWLDRFARGRVLDEHGVPLAATHRYSEGLRIYYFREVPAETPIPFAEKIVHMDDHLLVVDKPHFLPVMPAGVYVEETLQARIVARFGNADLMPLHRIDRLTAGLVLFSTNPQTRAAYQVLFAKRSIVKRYEALAPALPALEFPLRRHSRLVAGQPFFRMCETDGAPNSETAIEVCERRDGRWRYALYPVTGRKHQLRVQMSALGAPICNDPWYPLVGEPTPDDYARPLQLLAQRLTFVDPLSGLQRDFESGMQLDFACCD
jgi:tRNA pseudouridine32 synthase / 23S rRNA pseudouridine746 synthase